MKMWVVRVNKMPETLLIELQSRQSMHNKLTGILGNPGPVYLFIVV